MRRRRPKTVMVRVRQMDKEVLKRLASVQGLQIPDYMRRVVRKLKNGNTKYN